MEQPLVGMDITTAYMVADLDGREQGLLDDNNPNSIGDVEPVIFGDEQMKLHGVYLGAGFSLVQTTLTGINLTPT